MELEFIKMHLAGRDAVVVDAGRNHDAAPGLLQRVAGAALDRRRGIGGDAVLLLGRPDDGDGLPVRAFGPGGAELEPSLNELLCAGRYAIDSGLGEGTAARLRSALRSVEIDALDLRSVVADIGPPADAGGEELVERPEVAYTRSVRLDERDFTFTPLSLGAFHAVAFVPTFDFDLRRVARGFREAEPLARGDPSGAVQEPAELTWVRVISRRRILTRTWRYGQGEARSEGYAAAAAAVAAALHGFADRDTIVATRGGELYVLWSEANNRLYVTGTPEYVFTGTYAADERRDGGQAV